MPADPGGEGEEHKEASNPDYNIRGGHTEAEHEQGRGKEREREIQNPKQVPGSELFVSTEPDAGLEPTNCETVT